MAAIGLSCESVLEELHSRKTRRRDFLFNYGFGWIAALCIDKALGVLFQEGVTPFERQADFQASRLIKSAGFDQIRGQFFTTTG